MSIPGSASPLFLSAAAAAAPAGFQIDRSLRFNSADSSYLNRTPSSAGNRRTWTWSGWVKRSKSDTQQVLFFGGPDVNTLTRIIFNSEDLELQSWDSASLSLRLETSAVYRDFSAWLHCVISVDTTQATPSNRVKFYINGTQVTDFATATYPSQNYDTHINTSNKHSIGVEDSSALYYKYNGYLADVHFIDGQALAPTDFGEYDSNNVWQPKAYSGTYGTNGFYLKFADNSSNAALGTDSSGNNNTWTVNNLTAGGASTSAIELDGNDKVTFPGVTIGTGDVTCECFFNLDTSSTSGFRRILSHTYGGSGNTLNMRVHNNGQLNIVFDDQSYTGTTVTQGVWHHMAVVRSGSTISFYYDGERKGTGTSSTDMTLNNVILGWGNGSEYFPGQIHGARITKQALYSGTTYTVPTEPITTTSQGATASNVLHLSATTSSTTTNSGTTADGTDGGDPTVVTATPFAGSSGIDSLIDTPTNYTAASGNNGGNYCTLNPLESALTGLNNGNLNSGSSGAASWKICTSTLAVSSGKYYWEGFTDTTADSSKGWQFGFCQVGPSSLTTPYGTGKWSYQAGNIYNQSSTATSVGTTAVANDLLAYALDMDAGTCKLYVNNSLVHTFTGITGTITPFVGSYNTPTVTVNFGQRPFAYTPPTNHLSLCTTNLPDPTIADGSTAFEALAYIGDGGTSRSISSLNFSPDLVWFKNRGTLNYHQLHDIVRGATKRIYTNAAEGENTYTTALTSFDSNGWTMSNGTPCNANNNSYIAWAWDGGTSTVSNTDGSITSNVRANASAGFSIVTWTAASNSVNSIGHGLNAAPEFIIVKSRSNANNWRVYTAVTGKDQYLGLNSNGAASSFSNFWSTSEPTSSTFGVWSATGAANNDGDMLAYCFAPVAGYSAFGSYTGNGLADGPFVFTGMRPKWLLLKRTDSAKSWQVIDTERSAHNVTDDRLFPDDAGAESSSSNFKLDILSNGFKCRTAHDSTNVSGGTYIYAAFAEHPFKTARAR